MRMHYISPGDLKGCLISVHGFPNVGWWRSRCSWLLYIPVATIFVFLAYNDDCKGSASLASLSHAQHTHRAQQAGLGCGMLCGMGCFGKTWGPSDHKSCRAGVAGGLLLHLAPGWDTRSQSPVLAVGQDLCILHLLGARACRI